MDAPSNVVVLDNDDDNREVSEDEIVEYAEFLGIDPSTEPHLMWIAREGVTAPIPHPWKACTATGDNIFYFNFETGESVWDHPCDEKYRQLLEEERAKAIDPMIGGHIKSSVVAGKDDSDLDGDRDKCEHLDSEPNASYSATCTSNNKRVISWFLFVVGYLEREKFKRSQHVADMWCQLACAYLEQEEHVHDEAPAETSPQRASAQTTTKMENKRVVVGETTPEPSAGSKALAKGSIGEAIVYHIFTPSPNNSQLEDKDHCAEGQNLSHDTELPVSIVTSGELEKKFANDQQVKVGDSASLFPSPRLTGKPSIPPLQPGAVDRNSPKSSSKLDRVHISPAGSRSGTKESSSGKSEGFSELSEEFDFGDYPSELPSRRGSVFNRRDSLAYSEADTDVPSRRGSVFNRRDSLAYSEPDADTPLGEPMGSFISFHFDSERRGSQVEVIPDNVEETICLESDGERLSKVHNNLTSLARSLSMLRQIRGYQCEYLQSLRHGQK